MSRLTARGFDQAIAGLQVPVLGICLGMQLLFERSDEDAVACLGIVAGRAAKLASGDNLSVPHMGWSRVSWRVRDALSQALDDDQYFYFVHSYALPESAATLATARHGRHFSAVIRQRNFIGCQFHPERSGRPGQRFLGNFLALGEKAA